MSRQGLLHQMETYIIKSLEGTKNNSKYLQVGGGGIIGGEISGGLVLG